MRTHVDLPTLQALQDEWQSHPPVHHLVAAYLNFKPKQRSHSGQPELMDEQDMQHMMSMMPVVTDAPKLDNDAWDTFTRNTPATTKVEHGQ